MHQRERSISTLPVPKFRFCVFFFCQIPQRGLGLFLNIVQKLVPKLVVYELRVVLKNLL